MKRSAPQVYIIILLFAPLSIQSQHLKKIQYQDRPHIEIRTKSAIYLYDVQGGGFSSLTDPDGVEWIGYKTGNGHYPESAATEFRGLPNLVYQGEDGGAGHPGFEKCNSVILLPNQIRTESLSGLWEWTWTFSEKGALLEISKTDTSRNYWFLYEGIPGGSFDPKNQYWGNNKELYSKKTPAFGSDKTIKGKWDWAYFGHEKSQFCFYVLQLTPDQHMDVFSYLGSTRKGIKSEDGMVVFGLGRSEGKPLMKGPNSFYIGFFESHEDPSEVHIPMANLLKNIKSSI